MSQISGRVFHDWKALEALSTSARIMADQNRPANATRKPSRTVLSTSNLWRQKNEIGRSVRQAEACSAKTCRSSREFCSSKRWAEFRAKKKAV